MELSNKINLAIAICTGIAALGSCLAAAISSSAARQAREIAVTTSREEKNRWITDLLFSLANRCNECVTLTSGQVMPTEANVSKMITILYNAIDLIKRESPENSKHHLKNFWIFLHSSIWVELKTRDVLDSLIDVNSSARAMLSSQYEKVSMELMEVVDPKCKN
ncbi:hypothetical protein [Cronobacter dublinensis]|uniref:hypothetical protein n=1 Tax=Cronobacter dublinensis TaxID=413497 RepID=UPI0024AE9AA1|nr:hypothetical protein [Cronobacter dublinensis]MDI7504523.1 hypothetical protein [Cronobacter dublinensis]